MPLTWYEVLMRLASQPEGSMRMQDLARSVLLSKSGVTRVVDRMEEAGLLERRSCAADRRGTYATVTKAGRAAFRRAMPVHLTGISEHFGRHLSVEEARVLRRALARVLADEAVHLLGDPPIGGMPLWRRAQLDEVHGLARVHLHDEPDPVRHGHRVLRDALEAGVLDRTRQRRRSFHDVPPVGRGSCLRHVGRDVVAVVGREALPLDRQHAMSLQIAERAVVALDVEPVAGAFEGAPGLVP